jgi:hypothetical protein
MMRLRCVLFAVPVVAWIPAPVQAQWVITPHLGGNVSGDVEYGKGGPGGSVGYFGGRFGFEFDFQRYQHFSRIPRYPRSTLPHHPTVQRP